MKGHHVTKTMKLNGACPHIPTCWGSELCFKDSFAISPFLLSLPPTCTTPKGSTEAYKVQATGHCSTHQDPVTPLPGICGVIALVQGKAQVTWILQLPIGELNCKITAQE